MIQYQLKSKQTEPTTFNMALSLSRIVFMGTPEFAVESLDAMIKAGFTIVGVVTAPDKPAGRGMKMNDSVRWKVKGLYCETATASRSARAIRNKCLRRVFVKAPVFGTSNREAMAR